MIEETMVPHSSMRPVRVRFAPSPTGSLHIGGLRTALFNWLFARHQGGKFILRIEDTDQKRFDPTALTTLTEALRWAGLQWDEGPEVGGEFGPYVQSERLEHYQKWANWLVENEKAYKCFCTPERLKQVNEDKEVRGEPKGYDRNCRNLSAEEAASKEANGESYVIRFKMPLDGKTVVTDAVRGEVSFDNATQQDLVLLKSDGFPTYHLAHVVDDYLMQISHVMRAIEWFPSYPFHVQLWVAFGWEIPIYAHLPIMLNPDGSKMSKRNPPIDKHGNPIPVMVHDYIPNGYLPEAMTNFLANIGWNFGDDREFFTMQEAVERFDLTRINPANSRYPAEKLDWLNGQHIMALSTNELAVRLKPYIERAGLAVKDDLLARVTPLVQERIKRLDKVVEIAGFFFRDEFQPPTAEMLPQKKMSAEQTKSALEQSHRLISELSDFNTQVLHEAMEKLAQELKLSNGQLFGVIRVAVTGQQVSTPLFETLDILGRESALTRIQLALDILSKKSEQVILQP
ncbi:MAG: glutamate--tRNA ligase [Anaerolineae bacterium]